MNNKISRICLLLLSFALTFGFAVYSFTVSHAQTRQRQATPTPTPKNSATPPDIRDLPPPPPLPIIDTDDVITIDTEIVNLNVRVVDRNNRPINSLRKDEFKIYENDVLQTIDDFSKAEVPTNYSLVIDNSGSLRSQLEKVIEAGKILIGTNRPDDQTSVIRFVSSEKIEIVQDFTPKKIDLNDALDNLYIEGGPTAIIDAVYLAAERVDRFGRESADNKRRALILVSDGEDRSSYYKEQQLFDLLRESEVQIYAIGFVNELNDEGGFIGKSDRKKAKSFLERLAKETGGKVYFPNSVSELNTIAQDIASELRTQYSITYYPTNANKDGTYRNIKVVVADGPNKERRIAITRSGRTAEREGGSPTLQTPNKRTQ